MNFFENLPLEVYESVFQHLGGPDLMNLSQVNRQFQEMILTEKYMRKVLYHVQGKDPERTSERALMQSLRTYRHMKISYFHRRMMPLVESFVPYLKSMTLTKSDFWTVAELMRVMQCATSAEEINLHQVYIRRPSKCSEMSPLNFKDLKVLHVNCSHAVIFSEAFEKCRNLERFSIKSGDQMFSRDENAIRSVIVNNGKLKFLGIHFNIFARLFATNDIAQHANFKLKAFHAHSLNKALVNFEIVRQNFYYFLINQMASLEEILLDRWMGVKVLKLIFLMSNLKKLTLKGFDIQECQMEVDWAALELHRNETIESITLDNIAGNFELFKCLLSACPNARHCSSYSITDNMGNFLQNNCRKLQSIEVKRMLLNSGDCALKDLIKIVLK